MRTVIHIFLFLLCITNIHAQDYLSALIPLPNSIVQESGKPFKVDIRKTSIYINHPDLAFSAQTLQQIFKEHMQSNVSLSQNPSATIQLLISPQMKGEEHYSLHVKKDQILIKGKSSQAVFYGIMTLQQLLLGDVCATQQKTIAPIMIDDAPRFPYRALMIDPARHFLPVEDVKFYIDQMVQYKYNVLQLHLTDDQGWRIEIKKHPQLASTEHYTQDELRDLIAYAALRNVEIIPEIDVPGHTVAILATYPELGCTPSQNMTKEVGKTTNLMLCASNAKVYEVYKDILSEIADLFPSKYIHLGGDESAIDTNWGQCEHCQTLMKQLNYTKSSQLMIPFFDQMLNIL